MVELINWKNLAYYNSLCSHLYFNFKIINLRSNIQCVLLEGFEVFFRRVLNVCPLNKTQIACISINTNISCIMNRNDNI